MANTTVKVFTPRLKTLEAASATLLDTAVQAQVNTLLQGFVNPKNTGATPGNIANGSIVINPTTVVYTSQNVANYVASVQWNEWLIPS